MIVPVTQMTVRRRRSVGDLSQVTPWIQYGLYALAAWWLWSAFKKGRA